MSADDPLVERLANAFWDEVARYSDYDQAHRVDRSRDDRVRGWYGALAAAIVPVMREAVDDAFREDDAPEESR